MQHLNGGAVRSFLLSLLPAAEELQWRGAGLQGLKTAAQVQRLEALQAKQQAVLRRKTEEAEAARRRLKVPYHL